MPFDNLGDDPLMREQDRKVHEDVPKWGNILPPINPNLDPVLQAHERALRTSYSYEKKPNGNWEIRPGFDPPGKKVWGNQPRGQVEVPPYSVQQGHAPGPHGMEQHQGGRVIGVADEMEANRQRAERERAQRQVDALDDAMKTQPPRYKGGKQKSGYATIVTPLHGLKRVNVKSPQYKYAKKGKNGYSMPSDPTVLHDPTGEFPRGTDLREVPEGQRDSFMEPTPQENVLPTEEFLPPLPDAPPAPPPAPADPPPPPIRRQDLPPGMIRDTDIPGTQFVSAPGDFDEEYPDVLPPSGEFPTPPVAWRDLFAEEIGPVGINPETGERWANNDEIREWYWNNRQLFLGNPRLGRAFDEHGNPVPGQPGVPGMDPRGDLGRLLGPFGQRRGLNNPPPQGQPQRPENWWGFPDAPRPPGAPPIMSDPGRPVQGQSRTPAPGMMYGNRQLFPGGAADPNAPAPGYIPGVDSRDYPPFDPNMPFGYQQPSSEMIDTISGQARRRQRKADKQAGRPPQGQQAPPEEDLTEENRLLEESIPYADLTPGGNLPIDQRIRVGEPDPFAQPGEGEGLYDEFDPALRDDARLTQSKIDAEERAAAIEDLIIKGEDQYLIDQGVLSRGEIARLKVELIREGKMEGESPAQRVIGGIAGATEPDAADSVAPDPSEQLGILQRIKAKRAANKAARQQGR